MKSALTRLTILFGASLILCAFSGPGSALAAKKPVKPTTPAQKTYVEVVPPTISGKKHAHRGTKGHKSTRTTGSGTTSTGSGRTRKHRRGTTGTRHHPRHHATGKSKVPRKSGAGHRAHARSSKTASGTGLTAAATTGSSGGISVWLLVIVILVLVGGSAAGILRYRRTH